MAGIIPSLILLNITLIIPIFSKNIPIKSKMRVTTTKLADPS